MEEETKGGESFGLDLFERRRSEEGFRTPDVVLGPLPEDASDGGTEDVEASNGTRTRLGIDPEGLDVLLGCAKCRYSKSGCGTCRIRPTMWKKKVRWHPGEGRQQDGLTPAPIYHPTVEEFRDPLLYIEKIRVEAERFGICVIQPPPEFRMDFAHDRLDLLKGNKRPEVTKNTQPNPVTFAESKTKQPKRLKRTFFRFPTRIQKPVQLRHRRNKDSPETTDVTSNELDHGFASGHIHNLRSFCSYDGWFRSTHFEKASESAASENARDPLLQIFQPAFFSQYYQSHDKKRKRIANHCDAGEIGLEEIEAEFWRLVEDPSPEDDVWVLYGQDIDTFQHGSGFPTMYRMENIVEEMDYGSLPKDQFASKMEELKEMAQHPWNINNIPKCKRSLLRYLPDEERIPGLMVPWLYVGSCMSAFCWHVEDHYLYSVNYHHWGQPKIWYGVPGAEATQFETAVRAEVPMLFQSDAKLLHSLTTMVEPTKISAHGVHVCRAVQKAGQFVITFPRAYHGGLNTGLNCAEAVNFATGDWLPWGELAIKTYALQKRVPALSHDMLALGILRSTLSVASAGSVDTDGVEKNNINYYSKVDQQTIMKVAEYLREKTIKQTKLLQMLAESSGDCMTRKTMGRHKKPAAGSKTMSGTEQNQRDQECTDCKRDLYVSAVCLLSNADQLYCLECASSPRSGLVGQPGLCMLVRHTFEELESMIDRAKQAMLEGKEQKKN